MSLEIFSNIIYFIYYYYFNYYLIIFILYNPVLLLSHKYHICGVRR